MFENFYLNIEMLSRDVKIPTRAHHDDAGIDFYAPNSFEIYPGEDILIPLKLKTEFPKGYVLLFLEKSGISTRKKIDIGAKVIDAGYRGEIHAHLFNNSDYKVIIKKDEKIVQGVITPCWTGYPNVVENISTKTNRGVSGFGSTDKK